MGQWRRIRPGFQCLDAGCRSRPADGQGLDFGTVWINTHIPLVAEMRRTEGSATPGTARTSRCTASEDYTRSSTSWQAWT